MTLADLHDLASAGIQEVFNISTEKCKKENGGKGFATEIYVLLDIDGQRDNRASRINILSEHSWEACKHVVGAAKGNTSVVYTFAVDRGTWMDRWFARFLGVDTRV